MNRYTVKKGSRKKMEYDVLIYENNTLVFRGSFCNSGCSGLTKKEREIIKAIDLSIRSLNYGAAESF